jgi:hypothetical protein
MKKISILLSFIFLTVLANAQGMDSVFVEVYYVSDANDSTGSSDNFAGLLPAGSVTYRVWVDMQPGYTLQAVYGVDNVPTGPSAGDHQLLITTSTTFFNNEDYGGTMPTGISVNNTRKNSVVIDSWFSMGGNAAGKVAVLKSADTDGALINSTVPPMLQNTNAFAGIPINAQDGMISGTPPVVNFVGIGTTGPNDLYVFDALSQVGDTFETSNGSIAVLGGVSGPDSTNRVLIGQFTTTGDFCFKLHLQLGTPSLGVENYVADSASGNEIVHASLTRCTSFPTGIEHHNSASASSAAMAVYPSPASDAVNIVFNVSGEKFSKAEYTVYGIDGRAFAHKKLGAGIGKISERIDVSALVPGMYLIETMVDGVAAHRKFAKN